MIIGGAKDGGGARLIHNTVDQYHIQNLEVCWMIGVEDVGGAMLIDVLKNFTCR
jgi:hypothetical protein